jgi:hypothetical protein
MILRRKWSSRALLRRIIFWDPRTKGRLMSSMTRPINKISKYLNK